jgi:hypothetical protein
VLTLPSPGVIFAAIVFGLIGGVAALMGWRQKKGRMLAIGIAMGIYPYFIDGLVLNWLIGIALTVALFVWRDD